MFTRYSSSIFSFKSLAVLALRIWWQRILHIWGSLILNCKNKSIDKSLSGRLQSIKGKHRSKKLHPEMSKYLISRVFDTIATKDLSEILCTVNYLFRPTVRQRIVRVRKLCFCRCQLVNFHLQHITLQLNQKQRNLRLHKPHNLRQVYLHKYFNHREKILYKCFN